MADTYAEFVQMMREQGTVYNGSSIQLAIMTGANTCKIGNTTLYAEDLYIPDRLLTSVCTKVNVPENHQDKSGYSAPLKAGDTVLIYKLSDTKYAILDRVVSGE